MAKGTKTSGKHLASRGNASATSSRGAFGSGWRNRITRYGEEAPDQLLAHELNFRIHPKAQQDALKEVLHRVGLVQNVIISERTGKCLDGHLRIQMAISENQPTIPITYVDVEPEEEALILASIDPLSAMAGTDTEKLTDLLSQFSVGPGALADLLGSIEHVEFKEFDESAADDIKMVECPECGHKFPA